MKKLRIIFAILSVLFTGYSVYAGYMTSGLKLLYMNSVLGSILSRTFRFSVIAAVLCIIVFVVSMMKGRKAPEDKAV